MTKKQPRGKHPRDEDEDKRGAAKSSDEFISMEDDDENNVVRMPPPAWSPQNQKPGYSEMGHGEERTKNIQSDHQPELEQAEGGGDDNVRAKICITDHVKLIINRINPPKICIHRHVCMYIIRIIDKKDASSFGGS
jgi:hypothetical protein